MIPLIQNELMKIFSKKSSWIYMILIVVFVIAAGAIYTKVTGTPNENWKQELQTQVQADQKELAENPEETFLQDSIAMNQKFIDENVNPDANSNWHFMNSVVVTMGMFVTLFSVIVCSGNVAAEFSSGTIKQLMIRPHPRWKILLSKYISVTIYSVLLFAVLIAAGYLVGLIFLGNGDFHMKIFESSLTAGEPKITEIGSQILLKIGLYLPSLVVVTAIAFMLSTLFKSQALAVGIGIFVLFLTSSIGGILILLMGKYAWAKFLIFPHLDLTVYALQDKLADGVTLPFSLIILAVYYIVFMALTFTLFQKRDISF